jgi:hypothetical protein
MIYGELGRFPLEIRVKLHMITCWSKLVLKENKLSSVLYRLMYLLKTKHQYSFKWLNHIEYIFQTNKKLYSSQIVSLHKWQIRSSRGILYQRPVYIGKCRFEVLNLVIQILECSDNLSK